MNRFKTYSLVLLAFGLLSFFWQGINGYSVDSDHVLISIGIIVCAVAVTMYVLEMIYEIFSILQKSKVVIIILGLIIFSFIGGIVYLLLMYLLTLGAIQYYSILQSGDFALSQLVLAVPTGLVPIFFIIVIDMFRLNAKIKNVININEQNFYN